MKRAHYLRKTIPLVVFFIAVGNLHSAAITSGSISISGLLPLGSFTLSGDGFTANGVFIQGNWGPVTSCSFCAPGSILSVNGVESGNDFGTGAAEIGGTPYSVSWGGLNAAGPSNFLITGGPIPLDLGPGVYTSTFSFAGELCGVSGLGIPQPCVANLPALTGSGVVSVVVTGVSNNTVLEYTSAEYVFSVPEPSTLALILPAGLFVIYGRRGKRVVPN